MSAGDTGVTGGDSVAVRDAVLLCAGFAGCQCVRINCRSLSFKTYKIDQIQMFLCAAKLEANLVQQYGQIMPIYKIHDMY